MKSEFVDKALEELQELNNAQMKAIKAKVDEIEANPTGHEDAKLMRVKGTELYRVKVREKRGAEIDHRIVYDILDGRIVIYSLVDRDEGYDYDELAERI